MSTLKTGTVQNNTGTGAPVFKNSSGTEIGHLVKAWVNFNGTGTVAIRSSFNVSSITDNGTGKYTINYTTAFANTNYSVVGTADGTHNGSIVSIGHGDSDNTGMQTANTRLESRGGHGNGSNQDATFFCVTAISG